MKNIKINEEFSAAGRVWMFLERDGKITLKNIREAGKSRSKEFIPPGLEEVKEFFKSKGYTEESAVKAYDYYAYADWKDSRGKQVLNWRQKFSSVWFKKENEIPKESVEVKNKMVR